jgi:hypothetical protein
MEKTIAVQLKEQRTELLEEIAQRFEWESKAEILSDLYNNNDCAVMAKLYLKMASQVRNWK